MLIRSSVKLTAAAAPFEDRVGSLKHTTGEQRAPFILSFVICTGISFYRNATLIVNAHHKIRLVLAFHKPHI